VASRVRIIRWTATGWRCRTRLRSRASARWLCLRRRLPARRWGMAGVRVGSAMRPRLMPPFPPIRIQLSLLHQLPRGTTLCNYWGAARTLECYRMHAGADSRNRKASPRCLSVPRRWCTPLRRCLQNMCQSGYTIRCGAGAECAGLCGFTRVPGGEIVLCPLAFTPLCGCLGKTIVHEMAHQCGADEPGARRCEWYMYHAPGAPPCP